LIPCIYPNSKTKIISRPEVGGEQVRYQPQDAAGEVLKRRSIGPYILTENLYPNAVLLSKHAHRHAFLTFVIEGTFR